MIAESTLPDTLRQRLEHDIKGDVSFDPHVLALYSTDASHYQIQPLGLVLPRDADDVLCAVRAAAEHGVSLLPRGGGTSLAGQAIGKSLVIDFSKYMDTLIEVNAEAQWARVQPGIIRDELNAALRPHGLLFAPDPATSSRANVGGMIANNSSGTKSILYGKTIDHIVALDVILADGTRMTLDAASPEAYAARCEGETREAEIYRSFKTIIDTHASEIRDGYPKVMRRVGGYPLDAFVDVDAWNLAKLFSGSEGTLGFVVEAKINLVPVPAATSICVVHYADLLEAIRSVETILTYGPSAVEILDRTVLQMSRENLSTSRLTRFIEGDPAAVLIVEFYGDHDADVAARAHALGEGLRQKGMGYAYPCMLDAKSQADVWTVRKNGLGLMLSVKGEFKPAAFIEDAAIPIKALPEYIDRVLKYVREQGRDVSMYAHASVGVIHVRPMLNLKQDEDVEIMKRVARFTFDLVREYGGSWSGEHGDGLVRSAFNREFFGDTLYGAFVDVKRLFDPQWVMNPGKVIEAPAIDKDMRYGDAYQLQPFASHFKYRGDGSFAASVEMCTGVGACRKLSGGSMCPSYRATRDEEHSTRGRANALRLAMTGQLGPKGMTSKRLHETLALCLSCKACKSECPSNVDMAKLKSEFLQQYNDANGITMRDRLIAGSADMARQICGPMAPWVNRLQRTGFVRRVLDATVGLSRFRVAPAFARRSFASTFQSQVDPAEARPQVALFFDTYLNYHEPHVGKAAVALLESCGFEVIPANVGCCQRPRISHGFLRDAKVHGLKTLQALDAIISRGMKVVVCEPSCASALIDDLPDLIDDGALAKRISSNVMMIDTFLQAEMDAGRVDVAFRSGAQRILIHGHCHQKALYGTGAMKAVLDQIDGLEVAEIPSGCCGMAGSFGYEKEHYEVSCKVGEETLLPAVRSANADTEIIACGFSCRHQIKDLAGREAKHWVECVRGTSRAV